MSVIENKKIPKIIHQTWKTKNIPKEFQAFCKKIKIIFKDFEYILWTDEDNRNFIKEKFGWFLPIYDGYKKNIERVDAVRYFILYEYGGIYMDLDYMVRTNFYNELVPNKINLVESYFLKGCVSNFLMASPPKLNLWKKVFHRLVLCRNKTHTLHSTGPFMITDSLLDEDINMLPFQKYNPPNPNICVLYKLFWFKIFGKKNIFSFWETSYGNHYNIETWKKAEILSFLAQYQIIIWLLVLLILIKFIYSRYHKKNYTIV
jgi:mannosyltransferase OCH1-like enzyme